jgi:hypothetical protein
MKKKLTWRQASALLYRVQKELRAADDFFNKAGLDYPGVIRQPLLDALEALGQAIHNLEMGLD